MNQVIQATRDNDASFLNGAGLLKGCRVLIIVENLPVPFDRRVWLEARSLTASGAQVCVVCPQGKGHEAPYEYLEGVHIYRHKLPLEANGAVGYLFEYGSAIFWETVLAWKIYFRHGFDVIHGCNPPDLLFLVAAPFRLFGVRYLFDHHDISPELYEAKFGKRGLLWWITTVFERANFALASVSVATNESYRKIAIERGKMNPDDVFIVRSAPDLARVRPAPPNPCWKNGRNYLVGYVGVMGDQEGLDLLLESARRLVHVNKREDIQFVLVGSGPSLDKLKKQAAEMLVDGFVTFTGRVDDDTLFEVLSTADVCVNPDRVNTMNDKSTMNKIMEYMAFSKPIIQFDVTEGRYSAQEASVYAKPNDAGDFAAKISELLADPDRRAWMGALGRNRVSTQLSWDQSAPFLFKAYLRILEKAQAKTERKPSNTSYSQSQSEKHSKT